MGSFLRRGCPLRSGLGCGPNGVAVRASLSTAVRTILRSAVRSGRNAERAQMIRCALLGVNERLVCVQVKDPGNGHSQSEVIARPDHQVCQFVVGRKRSLCRVRAVVGSLRIGGSGTEHHDVWHSILASSDFQPNLYHCMGLPGSLELEQIGRDQGLQPSVRVCTLITLQNEAVHIIAVRAV